MNLGINFEGLSKPQLITRLTAAIWNDGFGCFTRAGFEKVIWPEIVGRARHIVYLDVNDVKKINDLHGTYDVFNEMMRQALASMRSDDYVASQWNSGDEFLIALCETDQPKNDRRQRLDPEAFIERLTAELDKQGLAAIFWFGPVVHQDLVSNVKPMADKVLEIKKQRGISR